MLGGRTVKELYELKGKGRSIRGIADDLGISRVTVRKYVRSPGVPKPKPRAKRGSKLDAYKEYIDVRLAEGLENCVVLLRELRELGYDGGYSTLKNYVYPRRRPRQPKATMRFETSPGEQAQVDWGVVSYKEEDGRKHRMWAFVMVLGFSRAIYVEFVRRMEDLRKARAEGRLDRRMRVYLSPKVLIVDEFGIWPYDRESATAFFSVVSARYERGSIILTSNKGFADWGELLGDTVIATAILDRLLHHSHVLNIRGESYRLKDKRQAGLLTSSRLLTSTSEETQIEQ